ncbi:MAG: hypothetical protein MO852_11435, partial [Candidatus Devosia euplotis]|nr:hypothetical protein [Candidatus Devosia euplotis]
MTCWGGAARNALAKIATASPEDLRDRINDTGLWPVAVWNANSRQSMPILGQVRQAMRTEKALQIAYADEAGNPSKRTIWPVQLAYYEGQAGHCRPALPARRLSQFPHRPHCR